MHHHVPCHRTDHYGNFRTILPAACPQFIMACKCTPHATRLEYSGLPHNLQLFRHFFPWSIDFKCVSKRLRSPHRCDFAPQRVLASLNNLANVEQQGYSSVTGDGIPLFLIWMSASTALLIWAKLCCEAVRILVSPTYFLWTGPYFNICTNKTSLKVQNSQGVGYFKLLSSSPYDISRCMP